MHELHDRRHLEDCEGARFHEPSNDALTDPIPLQLHIEVESLEAGMSRNVAALLRRLLVARTALVQREQQVLEQIANALPELSANGTTRKVTRRASARRSLRCSRCDRRFALPMHLGRHLATSHRRRKAA
jgi:hypothetical protein